EIFLNHFGTDNLEAVRGILFAFDRDNIALVRIFPCRDFATQRAAKRLFSDGKLCATAVVTTFIQAGGFLLFRGQCKTGILILCQQLYKMLVCLYLFTQNVAQQRIGFRSGYALSKGTATDYGCGQNESNLRVLFHFTFSIKKNGNHFLDHLN
ncbi:hypothetical protein, partial [Enterobacter ludwigii]